VLLGRRLTGRARGRIEAELGRRGVGWPFVPPPGGGTHLLAGDRPDGGVGNLATHDGAGSAYGVVIVQPKSRKAPK
jgi:hypothetical protein